MQITKRKNSNEELHCVEKIGVSRGKLECIYYDSGLIVVLLRENLVYKLVLERLL